MDFNMWHFRLVVHAHTLICSTSILISVADNSHIAYATEVNGFDMVVVALVVVTQFIFATHEGDRKCAGVCKAQGRFPHPLCGGDAALGLNATRVE